MPELYVYFTVYNRILFYFLHFVNLYVFQSYWKWHLDFNLDFDLN